MSRRMIVTGGSRGIGAAIAPAATAAGYAVAVNYADNKEAADEVVAGIVASGGQAIAIQADVSRSDEVERLFAEVDNLLRPVDVLVNNAGIVGGVALIEEANADMLKHVFSSNVGGAGLLKDW
jgi:NAD(P)-dependent dehydrogenase (short-subunit alcohol dehydrogenase family)